MKLPLWATAFTIGGVIILITLGTWQLQRLTWKQDILTALDEAYDGGSDTALTIDTLKEKDFAYGQVRGQFLANKMVLIGPVTNGEEVGHYAYVPLKTDSGTVLVNMGWSKENNRHSPSTLKTAQGKNVKITGLAQKPVWNNFTPENVPDQELWFKADINNIANVRELEKPWPYVVHAYSASRKFDAAFPNNERFYPNNNHLQYAIFWYAMACSLIIIYILRFLKTPKD